MTQNIREILTEDLLDELTRLAAQDISRMPAFMLAGRWDIMKEIRDELVRRTKEAQ